MKMISALMKHRLSALMSRAGRIISRNPVPKGSFLDDTFLAGSSDTQGVLSFTNAEILQYGVVRLQKRYCLDLDYGAKAALGSWRRSGRKIPKAVALWSHPWMGYYHWILDILPKLCLMQDSLGADLGGAVLCYPRWLPAIEDESLRMLGLEGNPVVDTAIEGGVSADNVYGSRLPGWHQIPDGARLLRERLIPFAAPGMGKKIYVSRAGRRRITNEEELQQYLESQGFTIIEDRPRSLKEQISLFHEAEIVVAPHGAALANTLWCRPATLVLELANASYYPPFYSNLAEFCGLRHTAVLSPGSRSHWTRMGDSVTVDLAALKERLVQQEIA
jgi:hypothetical protein